MSTLATPQAGAAAPREEHRVLGAGVIGLGNGRHHCEGYHQSEQARLLAVCDLVEERLAWARGQYGCATFRDLDAFLAQPGLDVVSASVPNYLHRDVATKVLRAGKHCLLEKPIALTLEDADAILAEGARANRESGAVLTVDYHYRYSPTIRELKRRVDAGSIGRVCGVSIYYWRGPFGRTNPTGWRFDERKTGGMLVEEACWYFDCLAYLGGELAEVGCLTSDAIHPDFPYEDLAYANVRYRSGAVGHLTHSLGGFGSCTQLWVFGTEGSLWGIEHPGGAVPLVGEGAEQFAGMVAQGLRLRRDDERQAQLQAARENVAWFSPEPKPGYRDLINHVGDVVTRLVAGQPPLVAPAEARASLAASLAASASARANGTPVAVGSVATPWPS